MAEQLSLIHSWGVCVCVCVCVCERSITQSCPTLCDPMDFSLLGSSVHGIFQVRLLEWVVISCSGGWGGGGGEGDLPDPGIESIALTGRFFTSEPPGKSINELKTLNICSTYVCVKVRLYLLKKCSFNTSVCYFYNSGKA